MKKLITNVLAWTGMVLFCAGIALAQEAQIVHYDADAKADSKRPDFKGALIAIDFGGTSAVSAKDLFMKLGARDFVEGNNPCVFGHDLICVRVSVGSAMQVSSSGQSGGYGGNGYQSGGSFSGSLYPVSLDVFLVKYDEKNGGERPTVPLGHSQCLAPAGSGTSYSSSYGSRGGGTFYSSSTNDLNAEMGNAVRQDMNALLSRNALNKFLAWGTYSKWFPGADTAVADAFRR
jgi:hypothetical protein